MAEAETSTKRHLRSAILLYSAVSLGGAIGSVLRWSVSLAFTGDASFPWTTLFANVTGSFLIGFLARMMGPDGRIMAGPRLRHFVLTGMLGGYTTFSLFSLETMRLAQAGAYGAAATYVVTSLILWLAAVWMGDRIASRYTRLKGARS